jgi:dTDP-4-amino-4,6-dideoxygalactose transaminase
MGLGIMEQYQLLEVDLSKWIETEPENVVVCSSGTAALHLAIESLEVYNSCILLSDYNMIACARAIALSGSYPRLGDFNLNLLINPGKFPDVQSQTARISAIMPVHIYGRRCDMDIIHRKAEQYQCSVIEDMAEIHGVKPHAKSHAACWSFYKNKIVAGEEGGAVWFKDSKIAQRARMLRSLGFTEDHDFRHIPRGMNYRLSNANAAIIRRSLAFFEENVYDRLALLEEYDRLIPPEWKMPKRESPWVYDKSIL